MAAARKASSAGGEPSDSIRAVNALLTGLDKLKLYPNVLILTTSNITDAIDLAFVDRADIKQYIGLPNLSARFEILRSSINELIRTGIIITPNREPLPPLSSAAAPTTATATTTTTAATATATATAAALSGGDAKSPTAQAQLLQIARLCEGVSGRFLRKLPFQAHAFFIQPRVSCSLDEAIKAFAAAISHEQNARKQFSSASAADAIH